MQIFYKKSYKKSFQKLPKPIQEKAVQRIALFVENPHMDILNNHALSGELLWYSSINITGDYRALFEELSEGRYEFVEFVDIGTHSQLYR